MHKGTAIAILVLAATLEAGGDALVRTGIHANSPAVRTVSFIGGAVILFAYGYVVNAAPWDFGKLLGLYVVFFFVIAQVLSYLMSGQTPSRAMLLGGVLIVSGGAVIAFN